MKLQRLTVIKKLFEENGLDIKRPFSDVVKEIEKISDIELKQKIILCICSLGLITS